MNNNDLTTIIAADYMYLIILGNEDIMGNIVKKLNNNKKNNYIYVSHQIDHPCAEMLEEKHIKDILTTEAIETFNKDNNNNELITDTDIDLLKKYMIFDEGVETAQCLTYADLSGTDLALFKNCKKSRNYMLMEIKSNNSHFKISYPILQLDEEVNPDDLISTWIIDNDIADIAKDLTIKPVNIVGTEHDILVFAACINS